MPHKGKKTDARIEQGRQLARRLYDYKMSQLERLSAEDQANLLRDFPLLGEAEFRDVLRQVIEAKRYEQERIGWQAIPHDVAVLVTVAVTCLLDLRAGIVAGIAILVLLESLFIFYFNRKLYRPLSTLVWLTYPAYALLAYVLFRRGLALYWILAIVAFVWGGTFLLGMLARVPPRVMLNARLKAAEESARLRKEKPPKH